MTITNVYLWFFNKKKLIKNCGSIQEVKTVVLELKFQILFESIEQFFNIWLMKISLWLKKKIPSIQIIFFNLKKRFNYSKKFLRIKRKLFPIQRNFFIIISKKRFFNSKKIFSECESLTLFRIFADASFGLSSDVISSTFISFIIASTSVMILSEMWMADKSKNCKHTISNIEF